MKIIKLLTCVLITLCLSKIQAQTVNMLSDTGNVGVGTTSPSTKLEVIGDTKLNGRLEIINEVSVKDSLNVSKKLTVEQDILIKGKSVFSDEGKFKNDLRVLGTARMKEKLVVDSTANFKDKIVVDGLGRFNGDIKLTGDFIFGNNKRISYQPAINGNPEIIGFGKLPQPPSLNSCLFPTVPLNQFQGVLQSYGNNGIFNNVMTIGFDGSNGIIEMEGTSNGVEPRLLINYNCGKDIFMNTGTNGGNIQLTSTGKVGVGTSNPLDKFQIGDGISKINMGNLSGNADSDCYTSYLGFNAAKSSTGWVFNSNGTHNGGAIILASSSGQLNFVIKRNPDGASIGGDDNCSGLISGTSNEIISNEQVFERTKMVINPFGKVGIGISFPQTQLDVKGDLKLRIDGSQNLKAFSIFDETSSKDIYRVMNNGHVFATEITVKLTPFPDYVFTNDYKLMPITELGNYINKNKHLPNLPTASEVEKNGIGVGELQIKLVEKIEELTLYVIELEKRLKRLED